MKRITLCFALLTLITAAPAAAYPGDVSVYTDDPSPGGKATWTHTRVATFFWLRACDRQKDGHGVQAYASFIKGGRQNLVEDTDGANGNCKKRRIGISFTNMGRPV